MKRPDLRPSIIQTALGHPDLGNAERVFLMTVVHLPAEHVDDHRRPGSRGMDARGHFALHYDYLAQALHTSAENAKKLAQRLVAKGLLSKVHAGTFGRPAAFQALSVRGDTTYRITFRRFVPPYESETTPVRGDTTSLLTYRTHAEGDQAPTSGVSPQAMNQAEAARREQAELPVRFPLTGCIWHEHLCPEDCAKVPASREASA
jgi:hypothetical protein